LLLVTSTHFWEAGKPLYPVLVLPQLLLLFRRALYYLSLIGQEPIRVSTHWCEPTILV